MSNDSPRTDPWATPLEMLKELEGEPGVVVLKIVTKERESQPWCLIVWLRSPGAS